MAKKKMRKMQKRRIGPVRSVPKPVAAYVKRGLKQVRLAKEKLGNTAPKSRKAWGELHGIESRLSRLT